jgi:HAD superfamily hydrolase (TIGR01549 family)
MRPGISKINVMVSRMTTNPIDPAILFDLDGTLVDTAYQHVSAWAAALAKAGITIPHWKIHRRIGMSGKLLVRQLIREHGSGRGKSNRKELDIDRLEKQHDIFFKKLRGSIRPLPGTNELLRHLTRNGVRWAIATTGGMEQTRQLLKIGGIHAETLVTGDDVEKAKPAPDIFIMAANQLKVPIDHCIVVGDSVWDMLAAGRRRALAVGFLSGGYGKAELEESGAFRVYSDAADMLKHIEDLGIG